MKILTAEKFKHTHTTFRGLNKMALDVQKLKGVRVLHTIKTPWKLHLQYGSIWLITHNVNMHPLTNNKIVVAYIVGQN